MPHPQMACTEDDSLNLSYFCVAYPNEVVPACMTPNTLWELQVPGRRSSHCVEPPHFCSSDPDHEFITWVAGEESFRLSHDAAWLQKSNLFHADGAQGCLQHISIHR
jgi:hypothetical protein